MTTNDPKRPRGKQKRMAKLAEGSGVHPTPGNYRVVIEYCEPTYAIYAGTEPKTYRGTFRVKALSPEHAEKLARQEFSEAARLSSVGWSRDIIRVMITED